MSNESNGVSIGGISEDERLTSPAYITITRDRYFVGAAMTVEYMLNNEVIGLRMVMI